MAGQGPDANGISKQQNHIGVLIRQQTHHQKYFTTQICLSKQFLKVQKIAILTFLLYTYYKKLYKIEHLL